MVNPVVTLLARLTEAISADNHAQVRDLCDAIDREETVQRHRLTQVTALGDAAAWYATNGIPVFPLIPGQKRPATAHGVKDATTDVEQVRAWWDIQPRHNIGIATGHIFDVVDADSWDAILTVRGLIADGSLPAPLEEVSTPRGRHFLVPPVTEATNAANLLPGVDYRARGGYVVAPPSTITPSNTHPGGAYEWVCLWPDADTLPLTPGEAAA